MRGAVDDIDFQSPRVRVGGDRRFDLDLHVVDAFRDDIDRVRRPRDRRPFRRIDQIDAAGEPIPGGRSVSMLTVPTFELTGHAAAILVSKCTSGAGAHASARAQREGFSVRPSGNSAWPLAMSAVLISGLPLHSAARARW